MVSIKRDKLSLTYLLAFFFTACFTFVRSFFNCAICFLSALIFRIVVSAGFRFFCRHLFAPFFAAERYFTHFNLT